MLFSLRVVVLRRGLVVVVVVVVFAIREAAGVRESERERRGVVNETRVAR